MEKAGEERIEMKEFGEEEDKSYLFSEMFLCISQFPFY